MNKWINVKDKLPSDADNDVWVYDMEDGVTIAVYSNDGWVKQDDHYDPTCLYHVTHWLPLFRPSPPSEEKDKFFTFRTSNLDLEIINKLAKRLGKNKGESIRSIIKEVVNALRAEELEDK